jgi:hypothetical protein
LFFIQNNSEGCVRASAQVSAVIHSEKMDEEASRRLVDENQSALRLTPAQVKRWAGKRYLVLVTVSAVSEVPPFDIDRSGYGNMDDWLPVGEIESVRKPAA